MIPIDLTRIELPLQNQQGKLKVFDALRKKWIILTPEEHVRQSLIAYMIKELHYPAGLIAVEKQILINNRSKRFDIVVFNSNHQPWMLVECKSPEVDITDKTLHQLLVYHRSLNCRYWMLSNGHQHFCADASLPNQINWLQQLPAYNL